jgi:TPR repeat protein
MNTKKVTILIVFTILLIFSVVSRIFFNDFQEGWNAYEKKDFQTARELWLPLAEQGEPRAQFFLGFMHDMGFGVPEDDKKALKWYQLAAEQGDSRAQLFTGYIYDFGNGVPEDDQKAVKWYRLASEKGFEQAKINIYNLAKKNVPEALKILTTDAENGEVKAQYDLAVMYQAGRGVPQDHREAVKWYQLAAEGKNTNAKPAIYWLAKKNSHEALKILVNDAENGSALAQSTLSMMYQFGLGVPQDNHEYVKWYRFAAERAFSEAKINIVNLIKKNIPQALKALSNDAENGDAKAQMTLGMMRQLGLVVPKDEIEATKWYRLAAEQGDGSAQSIMGLKYANGQRVPQDDEEAAKWYRLAAKDSTDQEKASIYELAKQNVPQALKILTDDADNGDAKAQLNLGIMLRFGLGVPKDEKEAAKWYRLAAKNSIDQEKASIYELAKHNVPQALKILTDHAERGVVVAQYYLGMMHAKGQGITRDYVLAHMWYSLSGLQRHEGATSQIIFLEKRMSPQQIVQAQEMVRDWKPSK